MIVYDVCAVPMPRGDGSLLPSGRPPEGEGTDDAEGCLTAEDVLGSYFLTRHGFLAPHRAIHTPDSHADLLPDFIHVICTVRLRYPHRSDTVKPRCIYRIGTAKHRLQNAFPRPQNTLHDILQFLACP